MTPNELFDMFPFLDTEHDVKIYFIDGTVKRYKVEFVDGYEDYPYFYDEEGITYIPKEQIKRIVIIPCN